MPDLSRCDHPRGDGHGIGDRGGRSWSRPALALLVASLVALCAGLYLRPGGRTSASAAASEAVDRVDPLREASRSEAIDAATRPSNRSPLAEIGRPDPPSAAVVAVARPDTLVYGSLLDPSRAPIRGAWSAGVTFVDRSGRRRSSDAGQEGSFALPELGFGTYWVTAGADGYRSLEESVELRPDRPVMRKDFTLQKSVELRIAVTTPEGEDLLDVLKEMRAPMGARLLVPVATREPPGRRLEVVVGSRNDAFGVGRFQDHGPRVDELRPGVLGILRLDCELPVWVSLVHYQVVLQTKRVDSGRDEVTFVLSPGDLLADLATIRVRVVDAGTGRPIQNARAMLWGGTHSNQGVATDPQGVATIEGREPGRFDLQVWTKGYESVRRPIDALPGEITDLGTIALEKEITVAGRALDLEGRPLAASFSVGILDPTDRAVHWLQRKGFESSGDGSFDVRGLGRMEYVIRTSNHDAVREDEWRGISWVSGNVLVDTRAGSISGLEVRLRPASRLVLHASGGAADGMRFQVVDERGLELVESLLRCSEPRPLALPAGSYRVFLLDPQGAVLSERSVALGAETIELDLAP